MNRRLENALLPRESWQCPRFCEQLTRSDFDSHSTPFISSRIELIVGANAVLIIGSAFGDVMCIWAYTMSRNSPYQEQGMLRLSWTYVLVVWVTELSCVGDAFSAGILALLRSVYSSSAGARSFLEYCRHRVYNLSLYRFLRVCRNITALFTRQEDRMCCIRLGVLVPLAPNVCEVVEDMRLSWLLKGSSFHLDRSIIAVARSDKVNQTALRSLDTWFPSRWQADKVFDLPEGHTSVLHELPLDGACFPLGLYWPMLFALWSTACSWWIKPIRGFSDLATI